MKKIIFALLFVSTSLFAQTPMAVKTDTYIPRTLYAGTSMSVRSVGASYSDTTQTFSVRGLAACYVGIEFSTTNDSGKVIVSYITSKDGVNFDGAGYNLIDSVTNTTAGTFRYIPLPSNALGAHSVRVRVWQSTIANFGINPSTTLTTKIIRIPYFKQ